MWYGFTVYDGECVYREREQTFLFREARFGLESPSMAKNINDDAQQEKPDLPSDRETIFPDAQDHVELRDGNLLTCQRRLPLFELARIEMGTSPSIGIETCGVQRGCVCEPCFTYRD